MGFQRKPFIRCSVHPQVKLVISGSLVAACRC
jgi:hypothetical protein